MNQFIFSSPCRPRNSWMKGQNLVGQKCNRLVCAGYLSSHNHDLGIPLHVPVEVLSTLHTQLAVASWRSYQLHAGSRVSITAKLSERLHVSLVQSITASKKAPHKQASSSLGSHPASTAASFQQSIVHRPIPATSPPTSSRGSLGEDATGDASATATDPSIATVNVIESFILVVC